MHLTTTEFVNGYARSVLASPEHDCLEGVQTWQLKCYTLALSFKRQILSSYQRPRCSRSNAARIERERDVVDR